MVHEGKALEIPDGVSYYEAAVTTDMAYVMGVVKRSGAKIGDALEMMRRGRFHILRWITHRLPEEGAIGIEIIH